MNRKQFLYRSALLSLAAAGMPGVTRAFQDAPATNDYLSNKFKVGNNEYAWFISIPALDNADEEEAFTIVIYDYNFKTTGASAQTKYLFKKTGKAQWENQVSIMSLKLDEKISGDAPLPPDFPRKPHLKASDKKQLWLETSKGVYTVLAYQAPDKKERDCFLTTACTLSKGLPDHCGELSCLRQYRDDYLKQSTEGADLVSGYYSIGPRIVTAIDQYSNREAIYDELYASLVLPSIALIREEKWVDAKDYYQAYVECLQEVFSVE